MFLKLFLPVRGHKSKKNNRHSYCFFPVLLLDKGHTGWRFWWSFVLVNKKNTEGAISIVAITASPLSAFISIHGNNEFNDKLVNLLKFLLLINIHEWRLQMLLLFWKAVIANSKFKTWLLNHLTLLIELWEGKLGSESSQ